MKVNKAFKFRIYPNKEQEVLFSKTFGCCRFIWNKMLSDKIDYYKETKKTLYTTPAKYKSEFLFLKEVDSLALANIQLQLEQAYKNFFKRKTVGFPKWKSKKVSKETYKTNNVSLDTYLHLPKMTPIKIKRHREITSRYKIKSATISRESTGKYFVSLLCEFDFEPPKNKLERVVGLDFSMKELFIASDGTVGDYPRFLRLSQEKLVKAHRNFARKKKGSKNREKYKIKVARIYEKVRNQRADFLHKLSFQITNDYDVVCIEDLDMKGMSKVLNFGKSISDNGWGMFTRMLEYKLFFKGGKVVKINKFFPSTKTCSRCGNVKEMNLSERTYVCEKCGLEIDRDYNSSLNILNEGIRILQGGTHPKRLLINKGRKTCVRSKP